MKKENGVQDMELDEFDLSMSSFKRKLEKGIFMKDGIRFIQLQAKIIRLVNKFKKGGQIESGASVKYNNPSENDDVDRPRRKQIYLFQM